VYWWPVYHALTQTGTVEVCVCNAAHMRNLPGRKTDIRDCQWIAELHEHGLLRPSFILGQQIAALRAHTRYRKKLIEHRASEGQRLSKVLEDADIKIDSVASGLLGVSGRDMIEALIAGARFLPEASHPNWHNSRTAGGSASARCRESYTKNTGPSHPRFTPIRRPPP
jgi:transposase